MDDSASGLSVLGEAVWSRSWAEVIETSVGDLTEERPPYESYRDDPNGFIEDVLGKNPWGKDDSPTGSPGQREWNEALVEFLRVSTMTGNGSGKSLNAAWLILWFMSTRKGRVIAIAPTEAQLVFELWDHVRAEHRGAAKQLPGEPGIKSWKLSPRWHARGLSTDKEQRVQGPHPGEGDDLFVVLEEASGLPEFVFNAVQGFQTRGTTFVLEQGNPNISTGTFAEHHDEDTPQTDYKTFQAGAIDCPRTIITEEWIERSQRKWGEDSPQYRIRVLGLPPTEGSDWQLFSKKLLNSCADVKPGLHDELHVGLDCARSETGDYNVCTLTKGDVMAAVESWHGMDTMATTKNLISLCEAWGLKPEDGHHVHIDVLNMGAAVVDRMFEEGWSVDPVDYGGGCKGEWRKTIGRGIKLLNRKAELHWVARERLRNKETAIPREFETTWRQLQWLEYENHEGTEVLKVKSKKSLAKRGIQESPDWADSWLLTHSRWRSRRRIGYVSG